MYDFPLVTIILAVKNEGKTIKKSIESILDINYQNYEIIVVDNSSTDDTIDILETFKDKIKILQNTIPGPSACRNMAIKEANGEYIAFTDGDCLVDKDWINELMNGFNFSIPVIKEVSNEFNENTKKEIEYLSFFSLIEISKDYLFSKSKRLINKILKKDRRIEMIGIFSVGGMQKTPFDEKIFGQRINKMFRLLSFCTDYFQSSNKITQTKHNPTCNVIYKKEVFEKIGYFREDFWPGEDVDFDHRLCEKGANIIYNPKAIVYHYRPEKIKNFIKMMFKYGASQSFLIHLHGMFRPLHYLAIYSIIISTLFVIFIPEIFFYSIYFALSLFLIYIFILYRNIRDAFWIYFLSIVSVFSWLAGFIKVLITKKFKV